MATFSTSDQSSGAAVKQAPTQTHWGLTKADFLLLICVTIWAFNVPLVKLSLNYFNPLALSFLRFSIAGLLMLLFVRVREKSIAVQWRHVPQILMCALLGIALNQMFFVFALKNTTSSEVSLLFGATPAAAVIAAWLAKQEKISSGFFLSLPISITGVALIILTTPGAQLSGGWFGDLLALAAAATWAAYTVAILPLMGTYSIAKLSAYNTLLGSIMLLPFGAPDLKIDTFSSIPWFIWLTVAYSTLGAVVLTNFLWYFGVKKLGSSRTAFYSYLQPFLGVLAAALILGEALVAWQILGGILVILGMIVYRRQRRIPRK